MSMSVSLWKQPGMQISTSRPVGDGFGIHSANSKILPGAFSTGGARERERGGVRGRGRRRERKG